MKYAATTTENRFWFYSFFDPHNLILYEIDITSFSKLSVNQEYIS